MDGDRPTSSVLGENSLSFFVNTRLYTEEAIFRACYWFTDRCYLFLSHADEHCICIEVAAKDDGIDLRDLAGELANELINQRIRLSLARDTLPIRQMIVAQAFGEAEFDGG